MKRHIIITSKNGNNYFYLEQLMAGVFLEDFSCFIKEYNDYLINDSLRSQDDHIALTWLLRDLSSEKIVSYMSIINDAIKLSVTEKSFHNLNYPFKTIPAMKIAKLAVSQDFMEIYKGVGSFMITLAESFARKCNINYSACRFLTVDADIEHNAEVLSFYEKNGFILNSEAQSKNRKTLSMRKDIFA